VIVYTFKYNVGIYVVKTYTNNANGGVQGEILIILPLRIDITHQEVWYGANRAAKVAPQNKVFGGRLERRHGCQTGPGR
jgi:hypothetical protein